MTASQPALTVVRSDPTRVTEAMSALLSAGPSAAGRFTEQARAAAIRLDLLWCAQDDAGRYRLAVLAVPSPGRTAMLVATRARSRADVDALRDVIAIAARGVADLADIAQALIDPAQSLDIAAFESASFRKMATLDYLERPLPRAGALAPPSIPDGWTIEPVAPRAVLDGESLSALEPALRSELIALLEATYIDTRDCPGLAGLRHTSDVLEGHFGTGVRRRHWLVARKIDAGKPGRALGLCLLNGSPEGTSAELAYFGVAAAARGKGIGSALLACGLHACSVDRMSSVTLALDANNEPAKNLYDSAGFRKTISRVALVLPLTA